MAAQQRQLPISIERCPSCAGTHAYVLQVSSVLTFGGSAAADNADTRRTVEVVLTCPKHHASYTVSLSIPFPSNEKILKVGVY